MTIRDSTGETSLYLGVGRVNHPRVSDEGESEKLNDFNEDEY
jgi:hypothetical protein